MQKKEMIYKKYIIDEYIENFKYDKFYSGFIEINAVSIILNKVIVILDNINFNNYWRDYSILAMFNKTEKEIFNINEIMSINYVSKNHYQILKIQLIKNRIIKLSTIKCNFIKYKRDTKKIIDIHNDMISILDSELFRGEQFKNNNIDLQSKKIHILNKKEKNSSLLQSPKLSIDSSESLEEKKILKNKRKITKILKKQKTIKQTYFHSDEYEEALKNLKEENILYEEKNQQFEINIQIYPILISNVININYYSEIYKYLYVKKFNLNLNRYPENINAIKKALTRDNKKSLQK